LLPKGSKVERINERRNGWVRIKAPAHLKVYAAAFCVDYDKNAFAANGFPKNSPAAAEKAVKPAEKAAVPAEKTVEKPAEKAAVPAENPAPDVSKGIMPVAEPKPVELKGVLVAWKYSQIPETTYALLDAPKGRNLGFVTSLDSAALAALVDKKVTVAGRITGTTGAGAAVIVADAIVADKAE
jgi:hypothetical protein